MSFFRSPVFLDLETLVPLANFHDIEVMTDLSLLERDLGKKSANAGVKMGIPGGPNWKSEVAVTRSRRLPNRGQ